MFLVNQIIAHRGASAYAPENTMVAFDKALALGCRFIEFDVALSVDGEAFVFHDSNLKRTTNGKGEIGLVTSEYLQSLDAGSWFSRRFREEKIPLLRDVLEWLVFSDVQANIEIKPYPGATEETTMAVLRHINRYWPQGKPLPLVSSFDQDALHLCHSIAPEMPLGLLLDTWHEDWLQMASDLHCVSIHLNKSILNETRVRALKEQGYIVCAYTVNRKRQALKLFKWGVDAIFSNYPDLIT